MKKILVVVTMLVSSIAYGQFESGGLVVGASSNLSFTSNSQDGVDDNTNVFSLNTQVGYLVIDNLAVGALIGYENESQGDFSQSSTVIGPWARFYLGGAFIGAAYGSVSSKFDFGSGSTGELSGGQLLFEAGYPIFIGDNVALEPALLYSSGSGDFEGSSSIGAAFGFTLYLD